MKILYRYLVFLLVFAACQENDKNNIYDYVNPFVGTGGHGHTFPGPTLPFGMVQLGPDTRLTGWDGCSGYHYTDSIIYGFSHTHLSGTGISDYGDVLLMPFNNTSGIDLEQISNQKQIPSHFDKQTEIAQPGYYEVLLEKPNIEVKLTTTTRVGIHKYKFNKIQDNKILLDLNHRDRVLLSEINMESSTTISGIRQSQAWATNQMVYFFMEFSVPFQKEAIESGDKNVDNLYRILSIPDGETELIVKVGISSVSIEGAKANLKKEAPHWDFDLYQTNARKIWEEALGKIQVSDNHLENKQVFYTALYHSMIAPNTFSDVDGKYRGLDHMTHEDSENETYTVFSLWDTFRAAHPLYTIIERQRTQDFINTFLKHFDQGKRLPVWELAANETDCMIGYHSIPVILDAFVKGIGNFDTKKALEAMLHSAELDHFGLESYKRNGVIYAEDESESVSKTLEYAYDDWCIAQFAKMLGDRSNYKKFSKRAQYYKNSFDKETGFMRARTNGGWYQPFDPTEVNFNYTEANSWQYSLFAPQDIAGLIEIMGGQATFEKKLDALFESSSEIKGRHQADITGMIGQYAHGNEPSHHMAYLYNFIGKPWKTQKRVQEIMQTQYWNAPDGLSGNEDCGQMSAWYVMSAMGFYSVTPGTDYYVIGSPLFDKVTINLENGKKFIIKTLNRSNEKSYIAGAFLNGNSYSKSFLLHDDIMNGGELVLEMSNKASTEFGTKMSDVPVSRINDYKIVSNPAIQSYQRTFTDSLEVLIQNSSPETSNYYAIETGSDNQKVLWKKYDKPFYIHNTSAIKAKSVNAFGDESFIVKGSFFKIDGNRSIQLNAQYDNQYAADGQKALIDGIKGNNNFKTGVWQGYQGQDVEAIVDLGGIKLISSISTGFLQDIKSWIWYPDYVEYYVSEDGQSYKKLKRVNTTFSKLEEGAFTTTFDCNVPVSTRFVKMVAKNFGKCPEWHLGAGGDTWIFIDEITIN